MTKPRLTKAGRDWVRSSLISQLVRWGLTPEKAVAAVDHGRPSMFEQVSRRIARQSLWQVEHRFTVEMVTLAFADWIAYKAGVREVDA